jgi:hypothetical protein
MGDRPVGVGPIPPDSDVPPTNSKPVWTRVRYFLSEDQRELMVTECNRLLTVAHDFIQVDSRMDSFLLLLLF